MKTSIPNDVLRLIDELRYEIKRDSYNLTQLDHDAIDVRINQLVEFIQLRYDSHGK